MTILLGLMFGVGMVLIVSPWLFPPSQRAVERRVQPLRRARDLIAEAGVRTSPLALLMLSAVAALLVGCIALLITRHGPLTVLAMVGAGLAPMLWLRARRAKRITERRALWPDVCELLVASVRAGMSLPDAVTALAESAPPPLRPAFREFARDMLASGHFDSSLTRLKAVLADATADRIIETLRMARQVGGTELPAVLRALAASVRQEVALRGEVNARQSWVRGAAVVGVIAPWAILGLLMLRPEGAAAYRTPQGTAIIIVAAVVSILAYRIMVRIGRLPTPSRWFG